MAFNARYFWLPGLATLLASPLAAVEPTATDDARIEFFEKRVRPVLVGNCYNCHSADTNSQGGLRVDDRNGLLTGGGRGPALVPGKPEESLMVQAIRRTHAQLKMPADQPPLAAEQIADIEQWIKDGAAWPAVQIPFALGEPNPEYDRLRREHWAWQPLQRPAPPAAEQGGWARNEIDRHVLAELQAAGLEPVRDANPLTLIRRVSFDLTGCPPALEETDEFVSACQSGDFEARCAALERLVDRLLASPAFGERWGRHWLDVARYGESTGSARNLPYPHAWRYRDYVIDAFNHDKPYDQFIREQIAGDLLPSASQAQRDERLIATGFLALGVCDVNQRFKVRYIMDNVDEQIDTVGRAMLGLTVSCARCHDHKFDPVPLTDYYALAGIFRSSDRCAALRNKMGGGGMDYYDTSMLLELGPANPDPRIAERLERRRAELADARASLAALQQKSGEGQPIPEREKEIEAARQRLATLQAELAAMNDPAANGPVALGAREAATVGDTEIRIRGEAEQLGPLVPRGFLSLLAVPGAAAVDPSQSGRLQLAEWLASPNNPLTPRVMANRVWQHLFGQGIVTTVDNFGTTGDVPSHPALLDCLAVQFVEQGWSVKKLIRSIVLSRTYQLSSEATDAHLAADPANRKLWRHAPRRLDAEEIRDAMLAAAGELDPTRPVGSPAMDFKVTELRDDGPEAKMLEARSLAEKHRSVYLPLLRCLTPRPLAVFDFAEQGMVTGRRDATTVATQALYLLNDPFVRQEAQALADRVLRAEGIDDSDRVHLAYRLSLGRTATQAEGDRTAAFLADYESALRADGSPPADSRSAAWCSFCQALLASAEFRYLR